MQFPEYSDEQDAFTETLAKLYAEATIVTVCFHCGERLVLLNTRSVAKVKVIAGGMLVAQVTGYNFYFGCNNCGGVLEQHSGTVDAVLGWVAAGSGTVDAQVEKETANYYEIP